METSSPPSPKPSPPSPATPPFLLSPNPLHTTPSPRPSFADTVRKNLWPAPLSPISPAPSNPSPSNPSPPKPFHTPRPSPPAALPSPGDPKTPPPTSEDSWEGLFSKIDLSPSGLSPKGWKDVDKCLYVTFSLVEEPVTKQEVTGYFTMKYGKSAVKDVTMGPIESGGRILHAYVTLRSSWMVDDMLNGKADNEFMELQICGKRGVRARRHRGAR